MRSIACLFLSLILHTAAAQVPRDSLFHLPDTARPFTLENFYEVILRYHPVARQANLLPEVARQEIRLARGQFDPKLEAQYLLKQYKGTEYYRLFDAALKASTRSPVTPFVGLERNTGQYLNPEHYISGEYDYKQLYAGITVPLGQGLLTDERRTALRQAELYRTLLEAEQVKMMNKLLLEAAKAYWSWYHSYYNYRLATNTLSVAGEIFRRTKSNFEGGEAAPIDTVQAKITYLERAVSRQEAYTDYRNNGLAVSTFLWDSLGNPVELLPHHVPVQETAVFTLTPAALQALLDQAKANHPELRKLNVKLQQLVYDQRLAAEFLKPKLNASYYMLNQPFSPEGSSGAFTWDDNMKLGVDFSFPIFLRKERSKVAQLKLKVANTEYDRELTSRQIINDLQAAYNQLLNNGIVLQQQQQMVEHYHRLMSAELTNLENGESDLFKINVQQEKLFQAESKLIKIMAEYEKQKAVLYWSAGVRPLGAE
ncbi:TolC family protein [Parachryseolinea silvisoli]|uniref:TolC family protein n=1 Tax=Parachryseolinea silvisoli TaxID=2873601 RepID=UPI0022658F36|nr:TolC family protein [Parachryseolinea silvisoli]MCD9017886.1 TolC family protein [Parachryseolinea silvisoli]